MFNKLPHLLWREIKTFRNLVYRRLYIRPQVEKGIVDQFHELYYDAVTFGKTWGSTYWLGATVYKCPLDLWIYQEIIFETRPDVIIESGTSRGGSALYLASICDHLNNGKVVTIDIEEWEGRPTHNRIEYLLGSSTSDAVVGKVRSLIGRDHRVMVILDSDHRKDHVVKEMKMYGPLVTKGCYLIVEDTNLNGHPVVPSFGPGPAEAVEEFLKENGEFVVDRSREKLYLTFNPGGYLRRTK